MEVKKCKPRVLLTGSALPPGKVLNDTMSIAPIAAPLTCTHTHHPHVGLAANKPVRTIQLQPLRKHRADIQPEARMGLLCVV